MKNKTIISKKAIPVRTLPAPPPSVSERILKLIKENGGEVQLALLHNRFGSSGHINRLIKRLEFNKIIKVRVCECGFRKFISI